MGAMNEELLAHLKSGLTTVCHAWAIDRKDGTQLGFTDHDMPLAFDGLEFKASTGLTAAALQQSTGLSVDNTEAVGALQDQSISQEDIGAGRYEDAQVRAWLVNWAKPDERQLIFRGSLGEITRDGTLFRAELRGLTEKLNRPIGRVYQKPCAAVLGDASCRVDLNDPRFFADATALEMEMEQFFGFDALLDHAEGWFAQGRLEVLDGAAKGLTGAIKQDYFDGETRRIALWEPIRGSMQAGDRIRLVAGCDKRMESCKLKFQNLVNYQGFPDLPGDGWLAVQPINSGERLGGSRR